MADEPSGQEPSQTDLTTQPPAQPEPPAQPAGQEPQTFDKAYVEDLRNEAASYRVKLKETEGTLKDVQKQLTDIQKAQEASEQAQLEEQGQYKELAEKNATKLAQAENTIKELEPLKDQLKTYEETLTSLLESQRQDLPEYVTELLDKMNPVEQLEWLNKHKAEISAPQTPPEGERGSGPEQARRLSHQFNPPGSPGNAETDDQRIDRLRRNAGQNVGPFG